MKPLNILLAIIIVCILYLLLNLLYDKYFCANTINQINKSVEKYNGSINQNIHIKKTNNKNRITEINDDPLIILSSERTSNSQSTYVPTVISAYSNKSQSILLVPKEELAANLLNMQFHNDYRDTIAAINNIVPSPKQFFNIPNLPTTYSDKVSGEEIMPILDGFIKLLNDNIDTIPETRQVNTGWDEPLKDPNVKSGWEKSQEELGLPSSLYNKPANNAHVRLINVKKVQKYETDDETKYKVEMVIQKNGVDDQMIIQPSFVIDKRGLHDPNNPDHKLEIDLPLIVQEVFITGFLTDRGTDAQIMYENTGENFYDFDKMETNNITNSKMIRQILLEKNNKRTQEMRQINAIIDDEGKVFQSSLPNVYDYDGMKGVPVRKI